MSSYSSANRRNYTAVHRDRRAAAPKQVWVPRGSITLSPPANTGSVPSIVQDIQDKLARGAVECMSCYDMVRRSTPIWSCSTCFSIFHLNCIRKWARSPASIAADDWHCPGCQTPQSTPARHLSYTCFCGRRRDPPNDQHLSPHSCGKPCGKPLDGGGKKLRCPHACVLQCHPGPCPPCKAFAPRRKCPCGKTNVVRQCSDRRAALSCNKPCNRFLGCGRHTCERVCHNGACDSCQELLTTKCFCGKKEQEVICSDVAMKGNFDEKSRLFSCDDVCGRSLLCGNHVCQENCHPGLCGECELLPGKISTCHCGKKKIVDERMTCMDLIPTCSNVCGKPLVCKTHFCRMRCHEGDCRPCSALVQQRCRCGSSRRTVECYQLFDTMFIFLCERTCYRKKNCGRHRCKDRCCVLSKTGDCDPHLCLLPCGKHTCQLPCHGGRCSPSLETMSTDLTCTSGMTTISTNLDALHVRENLATSDVFSDLMWRQPKEGSGSSMKVYVFCNILMEKIAAVLQIADWWKLPVQIAGWEPKRLPTVHAICKSKPGFLMFAAYPPAHDPLIDMDPRCVVALPCLPMDADISSLVLRFVRENDLVCLNDKNSLAVFSDPARVETALQRLSHGFTLQGAAPAAARSNECGNSSKWTVALEMDLTEASILVWRGNHGNPVLENANRWNLLDDDVVLESASEWEGRLQLEDDSLVESLV
ncbi:hypothetical protein KFK09_005797 [Dendrobium nobile]|uniref:NF-X1-type zinc finger protein NFXL1 n=1 Tax=Dendrobium nobile TaxID=94219 RepID=A0A8T3BZ98_DENNO|nr:hypothetical protein KFK09_005797 [Dendrobium nobile]